jgi:hypothetical protein
VLGVRVPCSRQGYCLEFGTVISGSRQLSLGQGHCVQGRDAVSSSAPLYLRLCCGLEARDVIFGAIACLRQGCGFELGAVVLEVVVSSP